jgi:small-conductance mechanosensitive channel
MGQVILLTLCSKVFWNVNFSAELAIPNSVLSKDIIYNIRRSGLQADSIDVKIPYSATTQRPLDDIIQHLVSQLSLVVDANQQHFVPKSVVVKARAIDVRENSIKLQVGVTHKSNFQDDELFVERRNKVFSGIGFMKLS